MDSNEQDKRAKIFEQLWLAIKEERLDTSRIYKGIHAVANLPEKEFFEAVQKLADGEVKRP